MSWEIHYSKKNKPVNPCDAREVAQRCRNKFTWNFRIWKEPYCVKQLAENLNYFSCNSLPFVRVIWGLGVTFFSVALTLGKPGIARSLLWPNLFKLIGTKWVYGLIA